MSKSNDVTDNAAAVLWSPAGEPTVFSSGPEARHAAQKLRTTIGATQKIRLRVTDDGTETDETLPHLPPPFLLSPDDGVQAVFDLRGLTAGTVFPYENGWGLRQLSGSPYYTYPPPAEVFATYSEARNTLMARWDDVVTDPEPSTIPATPPPTAGVIDPKQFADFVDRVTAAITRNARATAVPNLDGFMSHPVLFVRNRTGAVSELQVPSHIAQPADLVAYMTKAVALRRYTYLAAQKVVITRAVEDPENPQFSPAKPDPYPDALKIVTLFVAPGYTTVWATHLIDNDQRLHTRHWYPTHNHGIDATPAADAALLVHRTTSDG